MKKRMSCEKKCGIDSNPCPAKISALTKEKIDERFVILKGIDVESFGRGKLGYFIVRQQKLDKSKQARLDWEQKMPSRRLIKK